jgi:hypothetical protein
MKRRAADLLVRIVRSRAMRPLLDVIRETFRGYYVEDVLRSFTAKTAPLSLHVDPGAPRRIDILIPEINFGNFFGGYMAKFNLARRLAGRGAKVRLVLVDRCDVRIDAWRSLATRYEGLEDFFDHVEVAYCFDRAQRLTVSPGDVIVATTWWTAHIAAEAVRVLGRARFLYLVQEYEPFTFPMGTYYALARRSYDFAHHALFSSALLEEYFREQEIGVFGASGGHARVFENAILRFDVDPTAMSRRRPRKVLFYARPEPHAARNMFELGFTALQRAIAQGAFEPGQWEFHGIGSDRAGIALADGVTLQMIGKLGLDEYRRTLPQYDVGLALMYTPHPSLVPLEMAAAGMTVVTSTCLNKTGAKMAGLSSNILAAEPSVARVADALAEGARRAGDTDQRMRGAQVRWSSDWGQTFPDPLLDEMLSWFDVPGAATRADAAN